MFIQLKQIWTVAAAVAAIGLIFEPARLITSMAFGVFVMVFLGKCILDLVLNCGGVRSPYVSVFDIVGEVPRVAIRGYQTKVRSLESQLEIRRRSLLPVHSDRQVLPAWLCQVVMGATILTFMIPVCAQNPSYFIASGACLLVLIISGLLQAGLWVNQYVIRDGRLIHQRNKRITGEIKDVIQFDLRRARILCDFWSETIYIASDCTGHEELRVPLTTLRHPMEFVLRLLGDPAIKLRDGLVGQSPTNYQLTRQ